MRYVVAFVRFWWNFVVGDDWRVAAGLLAALALTWILAHHGLAAWWPLPLGAGLLLVGSVADEARKSGRA
ncbi:MAG TPA: hypothetical protein VNH45_09865 [Gaiellaceae bacterium]|jgi:hypothetical protein|nr:hypothetical protein [Gaiellaceae bacterium]